MAETKRSETTTKERGRDLQEEQSALLILIERDLIICHYPRSLLNEIQYGGGYNELEHL